MQVTLVGLGCGTQETITFEGRRALERAELILGAQRLLDALPENCTQNRVAAVRAQEIAAQLAGSAAQSACVVFSGDTGFYSGCKKLSALLREAKIDFRILPGISSVQLLAARLGEPWQDWLLCSAHGTDCDAVSAVSQGKSAFFLTGGEVTPAELCRDLTAADLGDLPVTVGENLSYPNERIIRSTARCCGNERFAPLSVLLVSAAPRPCSPRSSGIADGEFERGEVPMTKQEVRAAALGKLAVRESDTVWDVGAGTGSVAVELALAARRGRAFAVECDEEACTLIGRNRARFGAWNLTLIPGRAPEALADLPAPDAVFIGGSKGALTAIVDAVLAKNPAARICISAIALETLGAAVSALAAHGLEAEVTQISVSRTRGAGKLHLLMANNPVFLICAKRGEGA